MNSEENRGAKYDFRKQSSRLSVIDTNTFHKGKFCVEKVKELLNGN